MNQGYQRKTILSLLFNSLILLLELFALSEVFFRYLPGTEPFLWYNSLTYYTNLSNILLLIGSISTLIEDILLLKGKDMRKWAFHLKFSGVITTLVTFTTVYLYVLISRQIRYGISVQGNMWLLLHTICPILGFVSFFFFDPKGEYRWELLFEPYVLTWLYTLMVMILSLTGGRIPYAADMNPDNQVSLGYIFLCGLMESTLTFLLALLGKWLYPHLQRNEE